MSSARDKALIGIGGSIGLSVVAWRALFPWIGYDLQLMKKGKKLVEVTKKDLQNNNLVIDLFERSVDQVPKKTFVVFEDRIYTYEFMNDQACRVGNIALSLGLKLGDTVAILMLNEPAFIWTFLGLQKIGVAVSLLNPHNRQKPLLHTILVSDAKLLIVGQDQELREAVEDIHKGIDIPIYLTGNRTESKVFKSLDDLMVLTWPVEICRTVRASIDINSPTCYIFTSGTTGLPKPVPVSQMKILVLTTFLLLTNFGPDDVIYLVLPMYHATGIAAMLTTLRFGATAVLKKKFSAQHFFNDCRRYNVTVIQYIGELCRYLLALPESSDDKRHKIRAAMGNGLRIDIWEQFLKRFNINTIVEFYGSTEGPGTFVSVNGRPGAVGRMSPLLTRLSPTAQHLIKYDHTNQKPYRNKNDRCVPVAIGEPGLLISTIPPTHNERFYKGPQEMSEKKILRNVFVDGDKYFNSGDLMYLDKDYFLYFKDRLGDTFRWKGENVSTNEVANILSGIHFILDSNVYGVNVPGHDGRAGMAAIQLRDNEKLTNDKLKTIYDYCVKNLPSYARPLFLRLEGVTRVTATFKQRKVDLVKEGFDPQTVPDPLYYLSNEVKTYLPLDSEAFSKFLLSKL